MSPCLATVRFLLLTPPTLVVLLVLEYAAGQYRHILIEKHAGKQWNEFEVRQSVSSIDNLISEATGEGSLTINASDLILLLQGNVYEDFACNSVTGRVSKTNLVELQNVVRARVLELTIQLENSIPAAAEIVLGERSKPPAVKDGTVVSQITQHIVYGNMTAISSSGADAQFHLTLNAGDADAFIQTLVNSGIAKKDATALANIVASERPESGEDPFGQKAKTWLAKNLRKALDGTWKVGVDVASNVLTEAVMRYYGLK
jgi:AbiTii-like protein